MTQWKIKEIHPEDAYKQEDIKIYLLNRPIVEILHQEDSIFGGDFIYAQVKFSPLTEQEADENGMDIYTANEPFHFAGVILEEI